MMIAGGTMVIISFSMFGYYGVQFANSIQQEEKLRIEPGGSLEIKQNINASQGAYAVVFQDFNGQPSVTVRDPNGRVLVDRSISPPIIIEPFQAEQPGIYTLILSNPSEQVLEAAAVLGDLEMVLDRGFDLSSATTALALISIFSIGIAVAIAGAVITVLDRRRISRMKQFGDTSDLV
jgi:hypothetical protein